MGCALEYQIYLNPPEKDCSGERKVFHKNNWKTFTKDYCLMDNVLRDYHIVHPRFEHGLQGDG